MTYDVQFKGNDVAKDNAISLTLADGKVLGVNGKVSKKSQRSVNQIVKPPYGMASEYPDQFNELTIDFKENFSVIFRVYDSGVAYRFATRFPGKIRVNAEQAEFTFTNATQAWVEAGKGHKNWYEDPHEYKPLASLRDGRLACLPLLVDAPVKAAILESDLLDYPGMFLEANGSGGLRASFPRLVTQDSIGGGGRFQRIPYGYAGYLAETSGTRAFPWRIVVLAEQDKDLLYNNLSYLLASESKIGDASWVKPGKVAWDWYNANNLTGVDFKTGYNTDTYQYYIDFAARNGIEYILMDEGWSEQFDLLRTPGPRSRPAENARQFPRSLLAEGPRTRLPERHQPRSRAGPGMEQVF